MKIEFPRENMPEEMAIHHYNLLMDMYMHYEKMHREREFSYVKYAGIFLLAILGLMIMDSKGMASNYILGILIIGIGTLFVLAMNMIFISSEIDLNLSLYRESGIQVEEQFQPLINFHYFRAVKASHPARYRASLFSRLFPFVFVGGITIWAAISLSLRVNINQGVTIGAGAAALLLVTCLFLAKRIKKFQFSLKEHKA